MRKDDALKARHERAAAERFMERYNEEFGHAFVLKQRRESPDFEYQDRVTGETIGLEVGTVYYSEQNAKDSWDFARGKKTNITSPVLTNPEDRLLDFIVGEIQKKANKGYDYPHPIILVLDGRLQLTDELDIVDVVDQVKLPSQLPFKEVFLAVSLPYGRPSPHNGQYCVLRLYPPPSGFS